MKQSILLFLAVFFSLLIAGCGGGSDDGGTTGGSGSVEQLNRSNIVGDWSVVETYKNGETYQWPVRFLSGGKLAGGGSWRISEEKLYLRNPYSYWVAEDLSNSSKFIAKGPVSNLDFSR